MDRSPTVLGHDAILASERAPQRKLPVLQSLRCVAASLVVIDHAILRGVRKGAFGVGWEPAASFAGLSGVFIFFVISGLIMYRTSAEDFGSGRGAARFVYRRVVRVVPLYWIATAIAAANHVTMLDFLPRLLRSLFFIPYVNDAGLAQPVLGVGWTLNYEMFFYTLFALALLMPRRVGLPALLLALVAVFFARVANGGDPRTGIGFYGQPILLLFAAGVVVGWAETRWPRWTRTGRPRTVIFGVLLVMAALTLGSVRSGQVPGDWQLLLDVMAVGTVVVATTAAVSGSSRLDRVLEAGGDASYSTYLFHGFILTALTKVWFADPISRTWGSAVVFVAVAVLAANIGGYVLHRLIERPLTRALRRF